MAEARVVFLGGMAATLVCATAAGLEPLPEGPGLASKFPADRGIESLRGVVLLHEDFEGGVGSLSGRWTSVSNKGGKVLAVSQDVPPNSWGRRSLQMTATRGENSGGHLWKLFRKGVDRMFARFYVKFAPDHPYVHHFVKIGAWKDSPPWPQGEAGHKHDGSKSFQTGIEPGSGWGRHDPPGAWFLYTYWCQMRYFGNRQYYGNAFAPRNPCQIPRGKWQCVEFMVKANDYPKEDGEQAFWVDGKLIGRWAPGTPTGRWRTDKYVTGAGEPFKGFKWRTTNDLKINTFWLLYYQEAVWRGSSQFKVKPGTLYNHNVGKVWFDDVVVATEYIGPLVMPSKKAPPRVASLVPKRPVRKSDPLEPFKDEIKRARERAAAGEFEAAARALEGLDVPEDAADAVGWLVMGMRLGEELKESIVQGAEEKRPEIWVDFFGRPARGRLIAADEDGIRCRLRGVEVKLGWGRLSLRRFYGVASKVVEDHNKLALFCAAVGLEEEAEREKEKAAGLE